MLIFQCQLPLVYKLTTLNWEKILALAVFIKKSHGWVEDYSCYEWMNTRLPSSQQVVAKMPFT